MLVLLIIMAMNSTPWLIKQRWFFEVSRWDNPNLLVQLVCLSLDILQQKYWNVLFSRRLCFVLCPMMACSYAELELCLAASFGLTILQCGTCFEKANIPTKDYVSALLPLLCPAYLFLGTPCAFHLPCTLFQEVLQSDAFSCSPLSVSSVLDEFALCGVFLFIYCKQIWSLPFVYSYTLSLCLGMHF